MVFIGSLLDREISKAAEKAGLPDETLPSCVPSRQEQFGDYQFNGAMALAQRLRKNPRSIAETLLKSLPGEHYTAEVAGPGFINFTLSSGKCRELMVAHSQDPLLGIEPPGSPQTIIIDFSSPNVAKPMHVGHIRSTIIGDSLQRVLRKLGHRVVSDNHVGDWGTQFGKLIYIMKEDSDQESLARNPMQEFFRLYVNFEKKSRENPGLEEKARRELVKLQQGDDTNRHIWESLLSLSKKEWSQIYDRLDIHFDETLGESFYQPMLDGVVEQLLENSFARVDDGAVVVFFPGETGIPPCIVRKKDGGFLYSTTDLATLIYRKKTWNPDRILYVTDDRQALHFRQIFYIAQNLLDINAEMTHIPFGLMKMKDGHFSTREGRVIELSTLLDEAVSRAKKLIENKNPALPADHKQRIAEVIGIGAVKYNDLSQKRETMITFDWDRMLSFEGNTAPYLQYTWARIQSIFLKGGVDSKTILSSDDWPEILDPLDRKLLLILLRFPESVRNVERGYYPHLLCDYLFGVAETFHRFYRENPVLKAEDALRRFRLRLCAFTGQVMECGLGLLGIQVIHPM